jgi:hypothetical protein
MVVSFKTNDWLPISWNTAWFSLFNETFFYLNYKGNFWLINLLDVGLDFLTVLIYVSYWVSTLSLRKFPMDSRVEIISLIELHVSLFWKKLWRIYRSFRPQKELKLSFFQIRRIFQKYLAFFLSIFKKYQSTFLHQSINLSINFLVWNLNKEFKR